MALHLPPLRRLLLVLAVVGVVLGGALGVFAAQAWAEDPSSFVEKLTDEERQFLVDRMSGWDELSAEDQERIAKNVVKLRGLSPEERKRLERRIGALERHREAHGHLPGGFGRLRGRPDRREEMRRLGRLVHAVGTRFWASLSEAERLQAQEALDKRQRGALERIFFYRLMAQKAARLAEGGVEKIPLPDDLPSSHRARLDGLRRRAEKGDAWALKGLASVSLYLGIRPLAEGLKGGDEDPEALAAVGRRIQDDDPEAFAAAVVEARKMIQDPSLLEREQACGPGCGIGGHWMGKGRGDPKLKKLRTALKDAWSSLASDPRLREPAERLLRALEERSGRSHGRGRRGPPRRQRSPEKEKDKDEKGDG